MVKNEFIYPKILVESIDDAIDTVSFNINLFNPLLLSNIIVEYVNQDDLSVIPKSVHNYICSKIDVKKESSFKISYKELADLIGADSIFKLMLQEYSVYESGFLTIGVCKPELSAFIRVFKSDVMNDSRILNFYEMCKNGIAGLTLSSEPLLFSAMKNVCIWLNIDAIKPNSSWKDTLSHELSHFVQRISNGTDKRLREFDKILLKNQKNGTIQYSNAILPANWFDKISTFCESRFPFHSTMMKDYILLYSNMLAQSLVITERKTLIQNILNGFQRMFEQQNYKKKKRFYRGLDQSIDNRLQWLHSFLDKINSKDFFKTDIGKTILIQFYESSNDKLTKDFETQMKYKNSILVLQYIGIKILMPELQIDERLEKHFESFKFRDN